MDLSSAEFSEPPRPLQPRPGCGRLASRNARTAAWSRRARPRWKLSPRVGRVGVESEAQLGGDRQGTLAMTPFGKALGAQFEVSVDSKPRSYRDRKAVAI